MNTITIFGSGSMGQAIGGVLARGGASIQYVGSGDTTSRIDGDIVVLAVPYPALEKIAEDYADQLEAWRSDHFTRMQTQPAQGGVIANQNGYWGFATAQPVSANTNTDGGGGKAVVPIVVGAVVVIGGAALGILLARRRRTGAEDRE